MSETGVDVIVAVHETVRPVARAVASALDGNQVPVRVIVIAHNTPKAGVRRALGKWADDPRVLLTEVQDGIRSPAGPMNHGLSLATATFTSLLGSDDELQGGALDRWVEIAEDPGGKSDFVIANRLEPDGTWAASPPVRVGRRRRLEAAADRLSYRAAPLGLLRRSVFGELRFSEGVPTGEDVAYSAAIWFSGAAIAFAFGSPGYQVNADQAERITTTARSVSSALSWLPAALSPEQPWMRFRSGRVAFLVKVLRENMRDVLAAQLTSGSWTPQAQRELVDALAEVRRADQRAFLYLSRAESRLLRELMSRRVSAAEARRLLEASRQIRSRDALIPEDPLLVFSRQAPLRYHVASWVLRRSGALSHGPSRGGDSAGSPAGAAVGAD